MADNLTPWLAGAAQTGGRFAFNQWPGNGSTIRWGINFAGIAPGYLDRSHIKYYVTDDATGFSTAVYQVPSTAFISDTILELKHPVTGAIIAVGQTLSVYRDSPKQQPIPDFNDGSIIDEENLDTGFRQAVYAAAEMVDRFGVSNDKSDTALDIANQARDIANTANATAGNAVSIAQGAVTTANGAVATANGAVATANAASAKADTAVNTANDAKSIAQGIDGKAQQALNNSNTAITTANDAKGIAQGIDGKATQAINTANDANTKADTALAASNGKYNNQIEIYRNGGNASQFYRDGSRTASGDILWEVKADASNTGALAKSYQVARYVGGSYSDSPFVIYNNTGLVQVGAGGLMSYGSISSNGSLTLATTNSPMYAFMSANAGQVRSVVFKTGSNNRWEFGTNSSPESGSNNGSDLFVTRFADNGFGIDSPLEMIRSSGLLRVSKGLEVRGAANWAEAASITMRSGAGQYKNTNYYTGGLQRWGQGVDAAAESGSNAGSDWFLSRYNDAGTWIENVMWVKRSTGVVQFAQPPALKGRTDGSLVASGYIGETLSFASAPGGQGEVSQLPVLGLTLPPGTWRIDIQSILKDGTANLDVMFQALDMPGQIGAGAFVGGSRPRNGNWHALHSSVTVLVSTTQTPSVTWTLRMDSGTIWSGVVNVLATRIA